MYIQDQQKLEIVSKNRGFTDITHSIAECVINSNINSGLCHIFIQHTSASLIICENADPLVLIDLETYFSRLIPDGDEIYKHIAEGPDDMPSHIRTVLTQTFLMIPIINNKLALGTWQGIFLWEHRLHSHNRKLIVTLQGFKEN